MKIRKTYQGSVPENKILNNYSESQTDVYSCDYINKLNTYSTEEQVIGTYNDKPLYRKVITGTTSSAYYTVLIPNFQFETVVRAEGWVGNDEGGMAIGGYLSDDWYCGFHYDNANNLVIYHGTASLVRNKPFNATIDYTKITD